MISIGNTAPFSFRAPVHHIPAFERKARRQQSLKLLSFNIQVGIHTHGVHHYITRGWQHLLPHPGRHRNLDNISQVIHDYDVVALQEVDGGSFRSGFINQVHYLARAAHFPYWYQQLNRDLGKLAQHSNGLLSRLRPRVLEDHRLPGLLPGRGAITARFGEGDHALLLIMLHLSLGSRSRHRQLTYIRKIIGEHRSVILMGDLNCHLDRLLNHPALKDVGLQSPQTHQPTYPSWRPVHALDHILVSDNLRVLRTQVLDMTISDHRPVALEIEIPGQQQDKLMYSGTFPLF